VPTPAPQLLAYNTSKAAAINLTRRAAGEWGPYNIKRQMPSAPVTSTQKWPKDLGKVNQLIKAGNTAGRIVAKEDIKGVAVFLAD